MISRFGKYIPLIFLITFLFILFDSFLSFQQLKSIQSDENLVSHTYQVTNQIAVVLLRISEINTQQKKFVISHDEIYLKNYQTLWQRLNTSVTTLFGNNNDNTKQQENLKKLKTILAEKKQVLDEGIAFAQQGNITLPSDLLQKEDTINNSTQALASKIIGEETSLLTTRKNHLAISIQNMSTTIILTTLLTIILLIFTYLAIMRELKQRTILEQKKNEFISLASHELKTPITTMNIFAEVLKKRITDKSIRQAVQILAKMSLQIYEMKNLINDLLDVTRIQLGKFELSRESIMLNDVIRQTVAEIKPISKKHTIIYKHNGNVEVFADRQRIWQVLTNLLNNAIKYSPKGGRIIVTLSQKPTFAEVSVKDFGIGISRKNVRRVFDRYYREEGNNQREYAGLGLGLYLSQQIVTLHGGKIWAKSALHKGSTFSFTLPLYRKEL